MGFSGSVETPTVWTYPISSILLGMKALDFAKETYIRINSEGMLCIQHLITTKNDLGDNFVDICTVAEEQIDGGYELAADG